MIDDASTDQDMCVPPSNNFEKLRGSLDGWHSIRSISNGGGVFAGARLMERQPTDIGMTIAIDDVMRC